MQLDFDLQDPPEDSGPKIYTVAELTRWVRNLLEESVGEVWVEGEISNLRRQASGHQYFTLKDDASQLTCVLFSRSAASLKGLRLSDGLHVQLFGELTVYEARGQYQLIVRFAQAKGEGALQAKFEALKRRLAAEGLFAQERKRPLPRHPRRVGVVTSPSGAALRDFLHVLHRRHPGIEVLINPVRVQGRGAHVEIARAVRELGDAAAHGLPPVDVIVLTRGGGSIEDLWEFNEEAVARAIVESPVPVVSAIGHEIDFTIADFAADMRAPTPSAAAEILSAERAESLERLRQLAGRLTRVFRNRLDLLGSHLRAIRQSALLREPFRRVEQARQTLDRQNEALNRQTALALTRLRHRLAHASAQLSARAPARVFGQARLRCQSIQSRLTETVQRALADRLARLGRLETALKTLNPEATLARGFTITLDQNGRTLSTAADVSRGDIVRTRFQDGEISSQVQ